MAKGFRDREYISTLKFGASVFTRPGPEVEVAVSRCPPIRVSRSHQAARDTNPFDCPVTALGRRRDTSGSKNAAPASSSKDRSYLPSSEYLPGPVTHKSSKPPAMHGLNGIVNRFAKERMIVDNQYPRHRQSAS